MMRELSLENCRLDKRYDIVRGLGRGSYAEIFVAKDNLAYEQSPHKLIVIKALNVFLQDDLDADLERTLVENFQNEAVALDRVRHPNVINRLGHGTARDLEGMTFHYLVLEFMQGGDLQKHSREGHLTLKQALKYIEQVCAGLRHAHQHNIIHRDIKPQNLLLSKDKDIVKIADFGVARVHVSDAPITRVGTNIYAPPEHSPLAVGPEGVMTVASLTPAADIYSLAKSFYTIVTGESPRYYSNQPITDLPLGFRNEEWSDELKRFLKQATMTDPAARHQSIDDFWIDLEQLRKIALEYETATNVRAKFGTTPQARVSKDSTPLAPQEPKFDTTRDLRKRHPLIDGRPERMAEKLAAPPPVVYQPTERVEDHWPNQGTPPHKDKIEVVLEEPPKGPGFIARHRRALMLLVLGAVFIGGLYGTSVFLRNSGILPAFSNPFAAEIRVATTDVNLRPEPNPNNDPLGVVTKKSRVRVVNHLHPLDGSETEKLRLGHLRYLDGIAFSRLLHPDQNRFFPVNPANNGTFGRSIRNRGNVSKPNYRWRSVGFVAI
jgi:serine/threonine protein kinase